MVDAILYQFAVGHLLYLSGWTSSGVGRILIKRGLNCRARNFDHAHLITSRAAPRGIRTYIRMDMIWDGAKLYSLSSP